MLKLYGNLPIVQALPGAAYLAPMTSNIRTPAVLARKRGLIAANPGDWSNFRCVIGPREVLERGKASENTDLFVISREYDYLEDGDILRVDPISGAMRVMYRRRSFHNTILLTEQCNHYCLMCSQPPKRVDDSWLLGEAIALLDLIPKETVRLGFSGGEPTLYGDALISLLDHAKRTLPRTAVDLLSNGRAFCDASYARKYAHVAHPDLTIGVPIYSDDPVTHDYVVQSRGAFDETIRGILNLKELGQKVEIRIVIHRETIDRLVATCEYIGRNLLFVDHVALMGLEITGFTRANLDRLWIDPFDYKDHLSEAVDLLNAYGVPTSIYNHQLCTINRDAEGNYRKSISDWKNEYLPQCAKCARLTECGGLFSSSKMYKHSQHITPFPARPHGAEVV